jgi:hypothetical protein
MVLSYNPDLIVYLLLTAAIALLIFFTITSIRMIFSLSRMREMRRKKEMEASFSHFPDIHKSRFLQDMGKK